MHLPRLFIPHRALALAFAAAWALFCAGSVMADVETAEALYDAGKWQEAIAAYEEVLPTLEGEAQAQAISRMGYAWERSPGGEEQAAETYRAALDHPAANDYIKAYSLTRLGSVLSTGMRKHEEALQVLLKVDQLPGAHPNHIAVSYLIGDTAARKSDQPEVGVELLSRMQSAVDKGANPHYLADAWLRLAYAHKASKDYEKAQEQYRKVVNLVGATSKQKAYAQGYIDELQLLAQGDLPFYIQPYTTNVGHHKAEVFWVTQGEFEPGTVAVKDEAGNTFAATSEVFAIKGTECFRNRAVIEGLTPNTLYHYTVTCGEETRHGRFRANPTTDQDVEVVIGVTGDTQAAPDIHLAVAKEIAKDDIDFLIHVGDLTDHGSTWSKWRSELFEPAMPYLVKGPIWPAVGNHDGGAYFGILFGLPSKKFWFSFDYGPVHVVVLDSYWWGASSRGGRPDQLKWLAEDLKNTKAKWKIVALHVPMVATRTDLDWFGEDDFLPLMEEAGVDMVLSGHHPMYRKYLPLADHDHKPIYHVTTGGGGPTGPPAPSPILEKGSPHAHGTIIRIKGDTLELTSRLTDGSVIDQFTMHKHEDEKYQPSLMEKAITRTLAKLTRHLYFEMLEERSNLLTLGLDGPLQAGKPVRFTFNTNDLPRGPLDLSALPKDTRLLLKPRTESGWVGDEVSLPLDKAEHVFTFTAPESVTAGGGNIRPALELEMTLQVGDRRLEPFVTRVKLNREAAMQVASATGGLPPVWAFRLDPDQQGVKQQWYAAKQSGEWGQMPVTQWWETTLGKEYDGWGWYRVEAQAPKFNPQTHHVWLALGAVDESMAAYVNGQFVAEQIYDTTLDDGAWEKPRRLNVTEYLKPGQNLFVVKVQDLFGMGGIYGGAMLKTLPINRLTGGDMSDGLQGWQVTIDGQSSPAGQLQSNQVTVRTDNAMHVGEKALVVESQQQGVVELTRTFDVDPDAKAGVFYVRARSRAVGQAAGREGLVVNLFAGDKAAGKPLASTGVPPTQDGSWSQLEQPLALPHDGPQRMTVQVVVSRPGTYLLDEVGVSLAE